jgi:hypothetical protein
MRKLLPGGLVVFAGMVCAPHAVSINQTSQTPPPDYRQDPRLHTLQRFFQRGGCPAQAFGEAFLEAADRYELDWRLLPSLSWVESTGGKLARNNNLFGWDSGRTKFASMRQSIYAVGYRLAYSSLYRNKSLDGVLGVYNSNPEYGERVKSVMRRISPTE